MPPSRIRFIHETFDITSRELAAALNVAPMTALRWEQGHNSPTGLQKEVLQALHGVALEVQAADDAQRAAAVRGLILLGIGALIFYLLTRP